MPSTEVARGRLVDRLSASLARAAPREAAVARDGVTR